MKARVTKAEVTCKAVAVLLGWKVERRDDQLLLTPPNGIIVYVSRWSSWPKAIRKLQLRDQYWNR